MAPVAAEHPRHGHATCRRSDATPAARPSTRGTMVRGPQEPHLEIPVSVKPLSDVPADRPHFAIWPKRLPRAVIAPETSLWVNLEISAKRYPDKAAYLFFGRALSYRELHAQADAIAG